MKRKWLALLACLALLMCAVPMAAVAEEDAAAEPIEVEAVLGGYVDLDPWDYLSMDELTAPFAVKWERSTDGGEQWETVYEQEDSDYPDYGYGAMAMSEKMTGLLYRYTVTDSADTTLTFTLKLKVVPVSLDDVKDTLTLPAEVEGTFTQADVDAGGISGEDVPQHLYKVTLKAGETLEVFLRADTVDDEESFDANLYLLDSRGVQKAYNDDYAGSLNSRLVYTAAADGDYYIVATAISGSEGIVGASYTLTAALSNGEGAENIPLQPEITTLPTTISGTITEETVDYHGHPGILFPIQLNAGDILVFENVTEGADVYLYAQQSAEGNGMTRWLDGDMCQALRTGTYYLNLYTFDALPEDGLAVSADVRVIKATATAELPTLTLPYTGKLDAVENAFTYSDTDAAWLRDQLDEEGYADPTSFPLYQLEVPAGGVLSIEPVACDFYSMQMYPRVAVMDAEGNTLFKSGKFFYDEQVTFDEEGYGEDAYSMHIPSAQAWTALVGAYDELEQEVTIRFAPLVTVDTDEPVDDTFTVGDSLDFTLIPWGSEREHSQGSLMMGDEEASFVTRLGLVSYTITAPDGSVIEGSDAQGTIEFTMPGKYTLTPTLQVEISYEGIWLPADLVFEVAPITVEVLEVEAQAAESSTPESSTPESSTPESSTPESSKPESSKPESSKPETPPTGVGVTVLPFALLAVAGAAMLVIRKKTAAND